MTRLTSQLAGAILFFVAGLASAATPLLLPASAPGLRAKSGEASAVAFNRAAVDRLAPGEEVELALPDGSVHAYIHEKFIHHGGGLTTWVARSPLTGDNERAIITYGPQGAWGWMDTAYGHYRIYPSGEGHDLLAKRGREDYAPKFAGGDAVPGEDDPPSMSALKGVPTFAAPVAKSTPFAKAAPSPNLQSDVMFIYTRDLANKVGVGLIPMLHNLIATVNQTYIDSEVAITLRLVRSHMMDYPNANGSGDTLNAMRGFGPAAMNAFFDGVTFGTNSLRDQVGADFVALLRDGPSDTGGIASLLKNPAQYPTVAATQTAAMSVNNYCASGCAGILAHELGHNMGNHHDRATIAQDANGATPLAEGVFPYSYGHYSCAGGLTCNPFTPGGCTGYADCAGSNANDFGTIMSYFSPKVMKWSSTSPTVTCVPTGGNAAAARPCGGASVAPAPAGSSDDAQSLNHVRGSISAYRTQTIPSNPGSLQFTTTGYSGSEAGGTITFTVSRIGGSTGTVGVSYSLTPGTAAAGVDYTVANGTLSWADGDMSNKTFSVTIANDGITEGNETFTATLSNPTGPLGVHLGYPTTASGLISEPWPINGAAPAGFTTPSGAAWAVATDSTFDGTGHSWKSGAVFPPTGSVPPPSVTQFTGEFASGTLAFAYRVNSYPGFGFFEFLVDGTVVVSVSGDGTWQFFSTTITAGTHTLQWRYRPILSFACANAIPAPPQGASCADRAWIDAVSLPLAPAPSTTTLASSPNPSQTGVSVTFTATVSGTAGVPTGSVTFTNGATPISGCTSVALVDGGTAGTAQCATSSLPAGVHGIGATYSGSTTYASSFASPISQVVSNGPLFLTANPSSHAFGGQSMNTTSPGRTSTITNTSGSPVTVTAVTASSGYGVSHNCGTLAASATCTVPTTFTPPILGANAPVSGSVSIEYAGGGPTAILLDGTAERSLVTHYYRSILRRAPDSGGKTFWENEFTRVSGLGANPNETWFALAQAFYFSPEYAALARDNTGFVTDLYNTFFNRAPDSGGLAFWTNNLTSGMPREVALTEFMFSAEFRNFTQAIFGSTSARAEVDTVVDFYRGMLGRLPDNGGFVYWRDRFRAAQCVNATAVVNEVEAISSLFALSAEYAARNRSVAQYVGDLYNAFLRRGGDLNGVNFWIGQIAGGVRTRETVRVDFKGSAEFQARINAIINQGCQP